MTTMVVGARRIGVLLATPRFRRGRLHGQHGEQRHACYPGDFIAVTGADGGSALLQCTSFRRRRLLRRAEGPDPNLAPDASAVEAGACGADGAKLGYFCFGCSATNPLRPKGSIAPTSRTRGAFSAPPLCTSNPAICVPPSSGCGNERALQTVRRSVLLLGALLARPVSARGPRAVAPQDPPAPRAPPLHLPPPHPTPPRRPPGSRFEVRVIGGKADSLQRVPGSGTIVTSKEIEAAQPYDTAEMLNRLPGITARQEQEGGARLDIGVRGLDPGRSRNLLVLEDGIPMSLNPYAENDLYIAPQIERMRGIEVVKGSGSILFGPSTIGGVINFLTIAPPTRQTTVVEADYGSFNYKKLLARYGDTFGSRALYVLQGHVTRAGDGIEALPFEDHRHLRQDGDGYSTSKRGAASSSSSGSTTTAPTPTTSGSRAS